jgi:endonuclease/exonuclease/phosphatase family metal-dependent hydrolase
LHRTLSDLTPVIDVVRNGSSVVVAGDLNASTQFPEPYRAAYRVIHERLGSLGLCNVSVRPEGKPLEGCPCADEPCRHIRTLEGPTPYQNDYVYASPNIAEAVSLVDVERTEAIEAVSDHYPVVVDLG